MCRASAALLDKKQVVVITDRLPKKNANVNYVALTIKTDLKGLPMEFN